MQTAQTNPQVSVVIPTHNRASTVVRAIRSVLRQTYQNFEIILVDDGSTDSTREVLEHLSDTRLRYIRHDRNLGGGAARNTGIEAARGKYIAFLDSDDEWLPEKLERQVQLLEKSDPSVGVIYSGYSYIDENTCSIDSRVPRYRGLIIDELLGGNVVGTASTVVVRRSCFGGVRRFDSSMLSCQDWDMWISLAKNFRFDFVPEILVRYHCDDGGRITNDAHAVADGHLRIAKKYLEGPNEFISRQRAEHLFAQGGRLVHFGYNAASRESLQRGRHFLLGAFLRNPRVFRPLVHYLASFNRVAYRAFTQPIPPLRDLIGRIPRLRGGQRLQHPPNPKIVVRQTNPESVGKEKSDRPQTATLPK